MPNASVTDSVIVAVTDPAVFRPIEIDEVLCIGYELWAPPVAGRPHGP